MNQRNEQPEKTSGMLNQSPSRITKFARLFATIVLIFPAAISFSGCYERNLAPPVEYSQDELDKLNEEIEENIDWDE